ncbi:Core-2/I-Branching enzyme [Rhodoplanes sp. Z2-YC6860]|nr:Core-2/I-Branching enzyme [Rhodoplanes sp. Z2-YC6860]
MLTHDQTAQAVRLVNTLNRMFDHPPIGWHHDFYQSDLPSDFVLTENISLVSPHVKTKWGTCSLVEATIRALATLRRAKESPDWFIVLSGSDYPLKPAEAIQRDFGASEYDAHITHQKISYKPYDNEWHALCYESRYCIKKFGFPKLEARIGISLPVLKLTSPVLTYPFIPFRKDFHCFAGAQWFCVNQKAVDYLIHYYQTKPALLAHFKDLERFGVVIPDESYFQSVLCNAPNLKCSNDNWRYVEWPAHSAHPVTLTTSDLPKMALTRAHFARKFDMTIDSGVLDELDKVLLKQVQH